jgi:hypothetical protein
VLGKGGCGSSGLGREIQLAQIDARPLELPLLLSFVCIRYGEWFLGLVVTSGLEAGQVLFGVSACRARVEQVEEEVLDIVRKGTFDEWKQLGIPSGLACLSSPRWQYCCGCHDWIDGRLASRTHGANPSDCRGALCFEVSGGILPLFMACEPFEREIRSMTL